MRGLWGSLLGIRGALYERIMGVIIRDSGLPMRGA